MSSPVMRGSGTGLTDTFPPGPDKDRTKRSGILPARRFPATATWKYAVDAATVAPYRTMSTLELITRAGNESILSCRSQSEKNAWYTTMEGGAETEATNGT